MNASKDNTWTYIMVALLVVSVFTLFSIQEEIEAQRTPERIAAIAEEENAKVQAMALMEEERKQREDELIALPWREVESIDQGIVKAIAHEYHLWLLVVTIIGFGPLIMRRINGN